MGFTKYAFLACLSMAVSVDAAWSQCTSYYEPTCPIVVTQYRPVCVSECPIVCKQVEWCSYAPCNKSTTKTDVCWNSGAVETKQKDMTPDPFKTPRESKPAEGQWSDVTLHNKTGKDVQLCMDYWAADVLRHSPCVWIKKGKTATVTVPGLVQYESTADGRKKLLISVAAIDPLSNEVQVSGDDLVLTDYDLTKDGRAPVELDVFWKND